MRDEWQTNVLLAVADVMSVFSVFSILSLWSAYTYYFNNSLAANLIYNFNSLPRWQNTHNIQICAYEYIFHEKPFEFEN